MIDNDDLEKFIRDKINKEKMNFPKELDAKINNVMSSLPRQKEKQLHYKIVIALGSVALILIILFSGTIRDTLFVEPKNDENKIVATSNEELITKFKSEGYVVEAIPEDIETMPGGSATACRVKSYGSLEELVDSSDVIIQGEVLAVRYFDYDLNTATGSTFTESKIMVTESYNNKVSKGDIVTFYESGGFTTEYNMILMSGAKEKFGDKYYEICNTTPEEEEKAKDIRVFNYGFSGGKIMQPKDKVVLFGAKSNNPMIDGPHYNPVGGYEGKFIINDNNAQRIIPEDESTPSLKMSLDELSYKIADIIKNKGLN